MLDKISNASSTEKLSKVYWALLLKGLNFQIELLVMDSKSTFIGRSCYWALLLKGLNFQIGLLVMDSKSTFIGRSCRDL